jgi:YaiO family outer membrane protein
MASLVTVTKASSATPQDPPTGWALDVSGDRAGVRSGASRTSWWSGHAQITYRRESKGGFLVAVQPLRRFGLSDTTFMAAGWRHSGPWSVYAGVGATPRADFHYRRSGEVEVYRRVAGPWVAHANYRYLVYPSQSVHLLAPSVTRYGGRSEFHARLTLGRNTTHKGSKSALVRGYLDVNPRLRLGGGVAFGERIFDVTALPRDSARGFLVFVDARVAIGGGYSVGVLARVAEEGSSFDQTAVGLTFRKTF